MNLRLDRFASLYLVRPIQRRAHSNKPFIPILMYHSISDTYETGVSAYYRTETSPLIFSQHMRYLHDWGYSTITLANAAKLLLNGGITKKYVVITFDDGYADFYRCAFPELNRYGFKATVFLPTRYIGTKSVQFKERDCLTWSEIRELRRHGIGFGSHTVTHPRLSTLEETAVKSEVVNSKQTIEDNLGESVQDFSYPFAFPENNRSFIQKLRTILVNSGYRQGVSTSIGTARPKEDCYFLRRLPMNLLDDYSLFAAKLQGSYDWLHKIQYASKLLAAHS